MQAVVATQAECGHVSPRILIKKGAGSWIGPALVGLFLLWVLYQIVYNPGFQWDIVARYMFHSSVLLGVARTLQLTAIIMVIGCLVGVVIAVMNLSENKTLRFCGAAYVWFFRGTPALVQLVFWYNLAALFPQITFGIPFGGPKFFGIEANEAISSFSAAMLGLGLVESAYMAEIIRGGLLSVPSGQREASKALGHTPFHTFRRVVLNQAMKSIIPPTGNQLIGALKWTSIASVVALHELMHSVEVIYSRTFETIPLLIVAALWYLIMVSILSVGQFYIERHFSREMRPQVRTAP